MKLLKLASVGVALALTRHAHAFPELATHGYVNCTACHVSPSGGGPLTAYGRQLSKELLSTWSGKTEEQFLEGAVKTPDWLITGGDVRAIQTYLNNAQMTEHQFFLMQSDFALGARFGSWTVVGSLGVADGPSDEPGRGEFLSRYHYIMKQIGDSWEVRAGKFTPQYGINEPNHTVVTRDTLGFGSYSESYNVEGAYIGERFDIFLTAVLGRPDDLNLKRETGAALSTSFNFSDRNKIGISFYRGENDIDRRLLFGAWGIFSLGRDLFLLSEVDSQHSFAKASLSESKGAVTYQRFGWEIFKGLQIYGTYQFAQTNFHDGSTREDAVGPGVDFFPRPHVELRAEYLKERDAVIGKGFGDSAWLLAHYYF